MRVSHEVCPPQCETWQIKRCTAVVHTTPQANTMHHKPLARRKGASCNRTNPKFGSCKKKKNSDGPASGRAARISDVGGGHDFKDGLPEAAHGPTHSRQLSLLVSGCWLVGLRGIALCGFEGVSLGWFRAPQTVHIRTPVESRKYKHHPSGDATEHWKLPRIFRKPKRKDESHESDHQPDR